MLYLDNLKLSGYTRAAAAMDTAKVDDFDGSTTQNALGNLTGIYCNPGCDYIKVAADPPAGDRGTSATTAKINRSLRMTIDVGNPEAYAGYWTSIDRLDLAGFSALGFKMRVEDEAAPAIYAGIRTKNGIEGRTPIAPYATVPDREGWRQVHIPLTALRGLFNGPELMAPDVLFLTASHREGGGNGAVRVDDLHFDRSVFDRIADFESGLDRNTLGLDFEQGENGAASLSWAVMPDPTIPDEKKANHVCRISYGGSIGRDFGSRGGFSYGYWQCGLGGADARGFKALSLRICGDKGGEIPNFYLCDNSRRVCLRAKQTEPISRQWQTLKLIFDSWR